MHDRPIVMHGMAFIAQPLIPLMLLGTGSQRIRASGTLFPTMRSARIALVTGLLLVLAHILPAQAGREVLRYQGTIGQRHADLTLELEAGSLAAARYHVDQQPGQITASELRLIGTTIVMADDDGNLFHLHLQDGAGNSAIDPKHAEALHGTMQRGEDVDLPVSFSRVSDKPK